MLSIQILLAMTLSIQSRFAWREMMERLRKGATGKVTVGVCQKRAQMFVRFGPKVGKGYDIQQTRKVIYIGVANEIRGSNFHGLFEIYQSQSGCEPATNGIKLFKIC